MSAATGESAAVPDAMDPARQWRRSWKPWIPLFLVLAVALAVGTVFNVAAPTNAERALAIQRNVKCPLCQGETVDQSNSSTSKEVRAEINRRVDLGQSDDEIYDYLAERYQTGILLTPERSGVTGLVWVIPVVALVIALAVLVTTFRSYARDQTTGAVTDEDRELVARALQDAEP